MAKAYRDACAGGSKDSFRAKVNLVGFSGAGKTSLATRLSGEPFKERIESTEGIDTNRIKSTFSKGSLLSSKWNKSPVDPDDLRYEFNDFLLANLPSPQLTPPGAQYEINKTDQYTTGNEATEGLSRESVFSHHSPGDQKRVGSEEMDRTIEEDRKYRHTIETVNVISKDPTKIKNISPEEHMKLKNSKIRSTIKSEIPFSINLWDHGGQDEFLATQHLFLDAEATTLLVMDMSKPLRQVLKKKFNKTGVPNTPEEFLHYWLNALYVKASEKDIQPGIALVLTHKDVIPDTDVQQYVADYIQDIHTSLKTKLYSTYMSADNIYVVDNKWGPESDFSKLRNNFFKMITKQRGWGMKRPLRWLRLEADIMERAQKSSVKYLKYTEVKELAAVYAMEDEEIQSFLDFHHTLGDFVWYPDAELRHMVITDPQLLVDRFNALVTAHDFIDKRNLDLQLVLELKQGVVSEENLEKFIWKGYDIKFLTDLMTKFHLILPLDSTTKSRSMFLIPSMLPPQDLNMYNTEPFRKRLLTYNALHQPEVGDILLIGTFHKLLSDCSMFPDWKICRDHLSYTDASFEIGKEARLALTLLKNAIRVSIWCSRGSTHSDINSIIFNTKDDLVQKLLGRKISPCPKFLMPCPHWNPEDLEPCFIEVSEVPGSELNTCKISVQGQKCPQHQVLVEGNFLWSAEGG